MRKHLIAANWKMYKTPSESATFFETFLPLIREFRSVDVAIFPSITSVPAVIDAVKGTSVKVGAQDMHWMDDGAYTGETSPIMLLALGVSHVLVGHSERRQYFNETDETVNLKARSAIRHGLVPVICVGEDDAERQAGRTGEVLARQVAIALRGIEPHATGGLIFAYEPVWAIGTGKSATPEITETAHKMIRNYIADSLNEAVAKSTRILYGGSVKPENASSLCGMLDIDGALIGGASLDPGSLATIIHEAAGSRRLKPRTSRLDV